MFEVVTNRLSSCSYYLFGSRIADSDKHISILMYEVNQARHERDPASQHAALSTGPQSSSLPRPAGSRILAHLYGYASLKVI
ncbi:hypothetical protein Leryth_024140 [Lithospermum erythrorhizon]|nr:hypothetical protein Leryth_024140 [Lithospermum erythrorhizon]